MLRFVWALACLAGIGLAQDGSGLPWSEYQQRRQALREKLRDGVLILFGEVESERGSMRHAFRQESNFLYLTGWEQSGAILVMDPDREWLFIPRRNPVRERYTGAQLAPGDANARERTGFEQVLAAESFEARLPALVESASKIYTLMGGQSEEKLRKLLPLRTLADAGRELACLRMVKSTREIALLQRAADVSIEAHLAVWRRLREGLFEYQLEATLAAAWLERGCEGQAYPSIVGSGPNGVVLHYWRNRRRMEAGELVVVDAGAQCGGYAADITRTVPVSGRFTPRQQELYRIVLEAQEAAIAAARPGMYLRGNDPRSLERIAKESMDKHGKGPGGKPWSHFFVHGLGHHVGLDVHDATDPALPLAAGMVVTIEPGLYIPEEGAGVRIEDMVRITPNGAEVLTQALPKRPEDIEKALARRN